MMLPRRAYTLYHGEFGDLFAWWRAGIGPDEVDRFACDFARLVGVRHAIPTSSGRLGLRLILEGLDLAGGDEVLIPAFTLKDLALLLRDWGFVPVPVDVDAATFNLDPAALEARITPRTKVILATHIFGMPCDLYRINEIAGRKGLIVVEDCAHAAGASYQGRPVGSFGRASFFSFETIKPVSTFGGGMVVTDDEELARKVEAGCAGLPRGRNRLLRRILSTYGEDIFFRTPLYGLFVRLLAHRATRSAVKSMYGWLRSGARTAAFGFDPLQAALGREQLEGLEGRRSALADLAESLDTGLEGVCRPQLASYPCKSAHYFYVVDAGTPAAPLRSALLGEGIDAGVEDEVTDNCADLLGYDDCPVAARLHRQTLQLPLYPSMSEGDVARVLRAVNRIAGTRTVHSDKDLQTASIVTSQKQAPQVVLRDLFWVLILLGALVVTALWEEGRIQRQDRELVEGWTLFGDASSPPSVKLPPPASPRYSVFLDSEGRPR